MPLLKSSLLLLGFVALLSLPVYGASAVDSGGGADLRAGEAAAVAPSDVQFDPLYLTRGGEKGSLGGFLIKDPSGGIAATCEEYTIDCIEEEDDTCCADLDACLDYCERVCNGPCAPAN